VDLLRCGGWAGRGSSPVVRHAVSDISRSDGYTPHARSCPESVKGGPAGDQALVFAIVCAALIAPFLGVPAADLIAGSRDDPGSWENNSSIFALPSAAVGDSIARVITGLGLIAIVAWLTFRRGDILAQVPIALGSALLLGPTLFPSYVSHRHAAGGVHDDHDRRRRAIAASPLSSISASALSRLPPDDWLPRLNKAGPPQRSLRGRRRTEARRVSSSIAEARTRRVYAVRVGGRP